jgi:hypothetical protein
MAGLNMRLITAEGVVARPIEDEHERSLVGQHANAVARFLATGEIEPLTRFDDVVIVGHKLLTDPDELEAWAAQGDLEFDQIYDSTGR